MPPDTAERRTPELSETELEAIRLLSKGRSNRKVAAHLGVDEKTIRRWLQRPAFSQRLSEVIAAGQAVADRTLRSSEPRLVRELVSIALGKKKAAMPQVMALRDALTRLGTGKPERLELSGGLDEMSDEELERIVLETAREKGWMPEGPGEE